MKNAFLVCAVYGFALAALIFSQVASSAVITLFVSQPYTLGSHGADWMYWHGVGCFFVGLVNLAASRWTDTGAQRDIALPTVVIYGTWSVQNAFLMFSGRYVPGMWFNVLACGGAALLSLNTARAARG